MKFFAKLGHLILGILLGVCLVVGGVAAALFAGGGVGVVSDLAGEVFNPPEEVKKLSVASYIGTVLDIVSKYQSSTFGQMEDALGFNLTAELANIIGIDRTVLRDATVDTVFNDVLDGYTMTALTEKFGIELPDMPIFKDSEFLSKPVTQAFNYLSSSLDFNEMTVKDLDTKFGIALSGDPFDSETVQNSKISELGETVQKLTLRDFATVNYEAHVDMYDFEYITLSEDEDAATALINWVKNENYGNKFGIVNGVEDPVVYKPSMENGFHYFGDLTKVAADGTSVVVTAKTFQKNWIEEYNNAHPDDKVYSFVDWAKENPEKYELFKANPDVNTDKDWCDANGIPTNWSPFATPSIVENAEFDANRPVLSDKVLRFLGDATIGGINAKFATMTLDDAIGIGDDAHFLLKQVKNSTLSTVASDLTNAIETTQMKDLLGLTTTADVEAWEARFMTADKVAEWINGKTPFSEGGADFDYFATAEHQKTWIDATLAATGVKFYDEWEWKTANYGYYEELGSLDGIDKMQGGKLFDEWARLADRKSGTENDAAALRAKYASETAEYLNGVTEGTPEYAAAQAKYFAEKYDLYCYELAAKYCIAKPVAPEVIGDETPEKPVAANSLLLAIGASTSKNISQRIDNLYVAEIFDLNEFSSGIMSLISPYTTLKNLPSEMNEVMTKTEIIDLLKKDIFNIDGKKWSELTPEQQAKAEAMFGCTINVFLTNIFNGVGA